MIARVVSFGCAKISLVNQTQLNNSIVLHSERICTDGSIQDYQFPIDVPINKDKKMKIRVIYTLLVLLIWHAQNESHGGILSIQKRWPEPQIPVCFMNSEMFADSEALIEAIKLKAEREYSQTNRLRFINFNHCSEYSDAEQHQILKIFFYQKSQTPSATAVIGYSPFGNSTLCGSCNMNLGFDPIRHRNQFGYLAAIVSHELGHSIGMHHEHQRNDREQLCPVVANDLNNHNNQIIDPSIFVRYIGAYDHESNMNYCKSLSVLSETDIASINYLYDQVDVIRDENIDVLVGARSNRVFNSVNYEIQEDLGYVGSRINTDLYGKSILLSARVRFHRGCGTFQLINLGANDAILESHAVDCSDQSDRYLQWNISIPDQGDFAIVLVGEKRTKFNLLDLVLEKE